jgi:hypothetical protein
LVIVKNLRIFVKILEMILDYLSKPKVFRIFKIVSYSLIVIMIGLLIFEISNARKYLKKQEFMRQNISKQDTGWTLQVGGRGRHDWFPANIVGTNKDSVTVSVTIPKDNINLQK